MIFLLLLLFADPQTPLQGIWALRAGRETATVPAVMGASLYFRAGMSSYEEISINDLLSGIEGGDISMIVPLTALLVSEGRIDLAEIYWERKGLDLPATRNALLAALVWFGRYELYQTVALNPAVPPDMEGTIHSNQCGAVCAIGWMTTREDGLFHGEELVSPADIQILSRFFPGVNPDMRYLPADSLDCMFRTSTGSHL